MNNKNETVGPWAKMRGKLIKGLELCLSVEIQHLRHKNKKVYLS